MTHTITTHLHTISKCHLFDDIPDSVLPEVITFLNGRIVVHSKGEFIQHLGEPFLYAGIVLTGTVEASFHNDRYDKVNMNHFTAGSIFGEALALKRVTYSPIQVQAMTDCQVLILDLYSELTQKDLACQSCGYHHQLLLNLMDSMVNQNIFSNLKLRIVSQKSLRDRIYVYLNSLIPDENGILYVPFSKTALAEFLNVNRSALSRELGRMQDEGLLMINGHDFQVQKRPCAY